MRFCYVTPGSRTPRRYNCQPDLVERAIEEKLCRIAQEMSLPEPSKAEMDAAKARERDRVRPQFNSTHYGTPTYCQLAEACAEEGQYDFLLTVNPLRVVGGTGSPVNPVAVL